MDATLGVLADFDRSALGTRRLVKWCLTACKRYRADSVTYTTARFGERCLLQVYVGRPEDGAVFVGSVPYGKTVDAGRVEAGAYRVGLDALKAFKRVMAEARSQARIGDRIQRERVADHNKRSRRQWDAPDRVRFTYNPYVTVDAVGALSFKGDPVDAPVGWFDLPAVGGLVPSGGVHWRPQERVRVAQFDGVTDLFVTMDIFSSFTHLIEAAPVGRVSK